MAVFKVSRGQIYGHQRGRNMSGTEWALGLLGLAYWLGHFAFYLWG